MYSANNPVNAVDLDGKDFILATNPNNAGGFGHTDLLFQNENGEWFKFDMGGENSSSGGEPNILDQAKKVFVEVDGNAEITKIDDISTFLDKNYVQNDGTYKQFETTKDEDKRIESNAQKVKDEINSGDRKYNLWNYNCAISCQDVLQRSNLMGYHFLINKNYIPNTYQFNIMNFQPNTGIQLSPSSSAYGIE